MEPTIEENLNTTETFLRATCEEYDFNYDNLDKDVTTEGIMDSLHSLKEIVVAIFKRAIKLIVWIWKKLVEIVRTMITNFVKFVKKILGIKEKKPQTKIKYGAIIFESANVKEINTDSREDIINNFKQAISSISNEIRNASQKNINFMKQFESRTNSEIARDQLKESYDILTEKVIYDKTNSDKIVGYSYKGNQITKLNKEDDDAVLDGKSRADHMAIRNLNFINEEKLKLLKESQDIVNDYEMYKTYQFTELIKKYSNKVDTDKMPIQLSVLDTIISIYNALVNEGYTESSVIAFLKNEYFPSFENSDNKERDIKRWVNLKLNYNKNIKDILNKMLRANYKLFNITMEELDLLTKDVDSGDFSKFKKLLDENIDKFIKVSGQVYDFREIGLGCICFSKKMVTVDDQNHMAFIKNILGEDVHVLFSWISKYDVVLMAHGGDYNEVYGKDDASLFVKQHEENIKNCNIVLSQLKDKLESINSEKEKIKQTYDKFNNVNIEKIKNDPIKYNKYKEIQEKLNNYKINNIEEEKNIKDKIKKIKDTIKKCEEEKNKYNKISKDSAWEMESTVSPSGAGPFILVEDWVREAIKEGFKKILVESCNPGHHDLPDDLKNNKHVLIRIGMASKLM